jgi:hypothetical protein
MSKADYIKAWRGANPDARDRQSRAARARTRAMRTLAERHKTEFKQLLEQYRKQEGLPPVRG